MEIELSPKASRQLKKLKDNDKLLMKISDALDVISGKPYESKALQGHKPKLYSYRVDDWRILYEIHKNKLLVLVVKIAQRKEVYR